MEMGEGDRLRSAWGQVLSTPEHRFTIKTRGGWSSGEERRDDERCVGRKACD